VWHRFFAFTTAALALALLVWRIKTRDRFQGEARFASIALALLAGCAVGATGFLGGRMVFGSGSQSAAYVPIEKSSASPKNKIPEIEPRLVAAGQKLFQELPCQSCHHMEGKGGIAGPDLTHEAQRHADTRWHIEHLKDPAKLSPGSDMPPFDYLTPAELRALASYLVTRR
jgi:mono/diheme cytochrome c family protein